MRATRRMERDPSGAWTTVIIPQNQIVVAADNQPVATHGEIAEQIQIQSQTSTWKSWKVVPTINSTEICLWFLIMIIKLLSVLTVIAFMLSLFLFLKTFIVWKGTQRVIVGIMRRLRRVIRFQEPNPNDSLWDDLFFREEPETTTFDILIQIREYPPGIGRAIGEIVSPLWIHNPVLWLFILINLLISYYLLSFIHDSLQTTRHMIRTRGRKPLQHH